MVQMSYQHYQNISAVQFTCLLIELKEKSNGIYCSQANFKNLRLLLQCFDKNWLQIEHSDIKSFTCADIPGQNNISFAFIKQLSAPKRQ